MKKYIIITRRVSSMGGAQLFVLRRVLHLKDCGYTVFVVYTREESYFPLKEDFNNIPLIHIEEMESYVAELSETRQIEIIERLDNEVGGINGSLIETHTLSTIEWGEIIAARFGAKHLAYPLSEAKVSKYHFNPGKRVFREKLDKGEFYGCSSVSLSVIFNTSKVPNRYVNIGYDEREFAEVSIPKICYKKNKGDYVITTVSRLDKKYIEPMVKAAAALAMKYSECNFVVLIAGGCNDKQRENYLKNNYCNETFQLANLNIIYIGYIDKLGKDIYKMSDVFVGMGTASINAISQGCIAINIDPGHGMNFSSGIFGVDTKNFAYSESGRTFTIENKLEEVFCLNSIEKEAIKQDSIALYKEEFEMNRCFNKMDTVINSLPLVKDRSSLYISSIYRRMVKLIIKCRRIIRIVGNSLYRRRENK